jgi:hypothetical protein
VGAAGFGGPHMRNDLSDRVESENPLEGDPARFWEVQVAIGRVELGRCLWKEEQQKPQAAKILMPSHGLSSRTGQALLRSRWVSRKPTGPGGCGETRTQNSRHVRRPGICLSCK